jgi:hypothetical protein
VAALRICDHTRGLVQWLRPRQQVARSRLARACPPRGGCLPWYVRQRRMIPSNTKTDLFSSNRPVHQRATCGIFLGWWLNHTGVDGARGSLRRTADQVSVELRAVPDEAHPRRDVEHRDILAGPTTRGGSSTL